MQKRNKYTEIKYLTLHKLLLIFTINTSCVFTLIYFLKLRVFEFNQNSILSIILFLGALSFFVFIKKLNENSLLKKILNDLILQILIILSIFIFLYFLLKIQQFEINLSEKILFNIYNLFFYFLFMKLYEKSI